jgi:hypothetical protein
LIDDPMHACDMLAKSYCQLTLVKVGYAAMQDYAIAAHVYVQLAETCKVLRGKELLNSIAQFGVGSVVD